MDHERTTFIPAELSGEPLARFLERLNNIEETRTTMQDGNQCSNAPSEVIRLIEKSSFTPTQVACVRYLTGHWQVSVPGEDVYTTVTGAKPFGEWRNYVSKLVCGVRKAIPRDLSLYIIQGSGRYLFDWRREVSSWFVPSDRAEVLGNMPPDTIPLMSYCNQVEVKDSQTIIPRLTPTELAIVGELGGAYPGLVNRDRLIRTIWNHEQDDINLRDCLWVHISRLEGKIASFPGGAFDIVNTQNVGYALSRVS